MDKEKKPMSGAIARWSWEALKDVKTQEEFKSLLAQILERIDSDIALTLTLSGSEYVRIMGNAFMAFKYGEIGELSSKAFFNRALQLFELHLRNIARQRR